LAARTRTEEFHRAAKVLDRQLKGRKFITADTLTLADFSLAAGMVYADATHLRSRPMKHGYIRKA
jgi:glutathione S-transferase